MSCFESPFEFLFEDCFATPEVDAIRQSKLNAIDVTFDDEPAHLDPTATGDALNPDQYSITVTGPVGPVLVRLLQWIEFIGPTSVRLWFDGPLIAGATYDVSVTGVLGPGGAPMASPGAGSFVAYGAEVLSRPRDAARRKRYDIHNPQVERDAQSGALGTFRLTEGGDLENDSGLTYLRKRIFRRIATMQGAFFHLPTYGLGVEGKRRFGPTEVRRLESQARDQILQEPDVAAVRVTVSEITTGVFRLKIRVRDNLGRIDEFTAGLDFSGAIGG